MAYIKREVIPSKIIGYRQLPELVKCTRADGTFDYFIGMSTGVPFNFQYLISTKQMGINIGISWDLGLNMGKNIFQINYSGGGANYGRCTSSSLTVLKTVTHLNNKRGTPGSSSQIGWYLNNDIGLTPVYATVSGYAEHGVTLTIYTINHSNKTTSYGRTYDVTNGLPLDYKDIREFYARAYSWDGSKYREGHTEMTLRCCIRIPGQKLGNILHLYS